jgi:hypothetical protein
MGTDWKEAHTKHAEAAKAYWEGALVNVTGSI